jgi:hypothetical protein
MQSLSFASLFFSLRSNNTNFYFNLLRVDKRKVDESLEFRDINKELSKQGIKILESDI